MKPLPLTHTLLQVSSRKTIEYKTTAILYEVVQRVFEADELMRGPYVLQTGAKIRRRLTIGKAIQIARKWLTKREGRFKTRESKVKKEPMRIGRYVIEASQEDK